VVFARGPTYGAQSSGPFCSCVVSIHLCPQGQRGSVAHGAETAVIIAGIQTAFAEFLCRQGARTRIKRRALVTPRFAVGASIKVPKVAAHFWSGRLRARTMGRQSLSVVGGQPPRQSSSTCSDRDRQRRARGLRILKRFRLPAHGPTPPRCAVNTSGCATRAASIQCSTRRQQRQMARHAGGECS